jgi:hypothetical protein
VTAPGRPTVFTVEDGCGGRRGAPGWFVDWVRLGAYAALGRLAVARQGQLVLSVSAPIRAMAAVATAFGFCRQHYLKMGTACPPDLVRTLDGLETGEKVWLRLLDRVLVGTYFQIRNGTRIRTSGGTFQTRVVQEVRRMPAWVAAEDGHWLISEMTGLSFLQEMFPRNDPLAFVTSWSWDLVVVGSRVRLSDELAEPIGPGSSRSELGGLREIVRPLDPCHPVGWQSLVMSAHCEEPVWADWPEYPDVTILDGAYAVSRWLEECRSPLVIAILDRAEAGLDSAVSVLEQGRMYAEPLAAGDVFWRPPAGCELLAYRSRP